MEKSMSNRLYVGTRKGLFELMSQRGDGWDIAEAHFLGDPVSAVLAQPDGTLYAALDLGHFGAKLWRRDAGPRGAKSRFRSIRRSRRMPATTRIPGRSARSGHWSRAASP